MIKKWMAIGWIFVANLILYSQNTDAGSVQNYIGQSHVVKTLDFDTKTQSGVKTRGEPFSLVVSNQLLEIDKIYTIDFYLEKPEDIETVQFTLEANQHAVEIIKIIPSLQLDFIGGKYTYFTDQNSITVQWSNDDKLGNKGSNMFFSILIRTLRTISIDQAFILTSKITKASGKNIKGEEVGVNLNVSNNSTSQPSFFVGFGPNPVQNSIFFTSYLTDAMPVKFYLVDQLGRPQRKLMDRIMDKGNSSFEIDVSDFSNGIYFLIATVNGRQQSVQKFMIDR